jgi:hypothetical protein
LSLDFEITRLFERGTPKTIAKFSDENDAWEFMEAKVAWDHKTKVHTIYKLYHNGELIHEANAVEHETLDSGSTGSGKRSGFSPLPTSPKPTGGPPTYRHDEDDIDDE